jgi:hypothetical protein
MQTIKTFFQHKYITAVLLFAIAASMLGIGLQSASAASLPCDLYGACVAAHSTVRALKASYSGRLYQIRRSNGNTTDINTLAAGGYANAAAQDSFCSGTSCTIVQIYDQSGRGNNLTVAPAGGVCGADTPSNANAKSVTLAGHKVYAVVIAPHNGYRDNSTSGIPTGSGQQSIYSVFGGTNHNAGCCFDYGNAETNNLDTGNGDMAALYFGRLCWFSPCSGGGPWFMADLENGLFAGGDGSWSNNTGVGNTYVTGMLKVSSTNYAIRGGNASDGGLKVMYSGLLPNKSGYRPLSLQGAIILGIGGDNSCSAVGTFYEGAITNNWASEATENSIQSAITSVY